MNHDENGRVNYSDMNFHYLPVLTSNSHGAIPFNQHTRSHVTIVYQQLNFDYTKSNQPSIDNIEAKNCDEDDFSTTPELL